MQRLLDEDLLVLGGCSSSLPPKTVKGKSFPVEMGLKTKSKWAFLDLLIFWLTLHILILPPLCRHNAFSLYYRPPDNPQELVAREEAKEGLEAKAALLKKIKTLENTQRKIEATTRNVSSDEESASALDSSERRLVRLAVLVITVRRTTDSSSPTNYLARSLEPLIRQEELQEKKVPLLVCNPSFSEHPELEVLAPLLSRVSPLPTPEHQKREGKLRQQTENYVSCIRSALSALSANVDSLLVLEDDAVIMEGFFPIVTKILEEKRSLAKSWLDFKLYSPPQWQGFFDLCPVPLTEWVSTSCLLGILFEALLYQVLHQVGTRSTIRGQRRIFATFLASFTLLFIQRQHWSAWRRIHHQFYYLLPASQCCTPAVIYSVTNLPPLLEYLLNDETSTPVDIAISQYRNTFAIPGFLLQPNIVSHIGRISSTGPPKPPLEYLYNMGL